MSGHVGTKDWHLSLQPLSIIHDLQNQPNFPTLSQAVPQHFQPAPAYLFHSGGNEQAVSVLRAAIHLLVNFELKFLSLGLITI